MIELMHLVFEERAENGLGCDNAAASHFDHCIAKVVGRMLVGPAIAFVEIDLGRSGVKSGRPQDIQHPPTQINQNHEREPKHELGRVNSDAKSPENIEEGEQFSPVKAAYTLGVIRHVTELLSLL